MHAHQFLRAAEQLPLVDLAQIVGTGGLVVVAPHPDDESLGCGGLIAAARAAGHEVRIVVVSDGVGSHPNSLTHPPARLRCLRREEARAAAAALGVAADEIIFLDLPDRYVPSMGPVADAAAARIVEIARSIDAGALFVTWEHDPHVDHHAAHAIAWAAARELAPARLFAYPIWGWELPGGTEVGDPPRGMRLDITRQLPAKQAAVGAHRSQTTELISDDAGFCLRPEVLQRFDRPYEIYLEQSVLSRTDDTVLPAFFEQLHAANDDPWGLTTSDYERAKYAQTLAALPKQHYQRVLEVGCSIGVLTTQLADRCEHLLAIDAAAAPLRQARQRCAAQPWVAFDQMFVPGDWPGGTFDLILLSEVVYYLSRADVVRLVERAAGTLRPAGDVLLVNWTGMTDCPLSGDAASQAFIDDAAPFTRVAKHHRAETFRLDLLTRC